ncbi:MAG: hypothetical protein AB8E82_01065 [Aureispira sp.]
MKLIINSLFLIVLLAAFSSCSTEVEVVLESKTFSYDFNTGQINAAYAYAGTHPNTLKAEVKLDEMADNLTMVTVTLMNPEAGQTYMVHSHDKADPNTTPNGTPYNETPNAAVFAMPITAAEGSKSFTSTMSYEDLTTTYEGFLVVHDPLQPISTTDPTTYVVLGNFAR